MTKVKFFYDKILSYVFLVDRKTETLIANYLENG